MDFFDGHQPTDAAAQIPVGPDGQYKTGRPKYSKVLHSLVNACGFYGYVVFLC